MRHIVQKHKSVQASKQNKNERKMLMVTANTMMKVEW